METPHHTASSEPSRTAETLESPAATVSAAILTPPLTPPRGTAPRPSMPTEFASTRSSNNNTSSIETLRPRLPELNAMLSTQSPADILRWLKTAGLSNMIQLTSFGVSGMMILDLLFQIDLRIPTVFIDTLHHFDETLELAPRIREKYNWDLLMYRPTGASTRDEFNAVYGEDLWIKDSERYHHLVKVEPLDRALEELQVQVWITGRRRSQGDARAELQVLEIDEDGRLKVNPLAWVSFGAVNAYVRDNGVPYNPLLDSGYKSIGDIMTTFPVPDDAPERSGRWVGEARTECGIHSKNRPKNKMNKTKSQQSAEESADDAPASSAESSMAPTPVNRSPVIMRRPVAVAD